MIKKIILILAFCFGALAQSQIKGTVKDTNGAVLPYVNIFVKNSYTGTTSNAEGYYEIDVSKPGEYAVVFQFLGFKTQIKNIKIDSFPYNLDIILEDENINLKEVVIDAKENPADRIVKAAIAKRSLYLEKLNTYTADFYSKGFIRIVNAPEKFMGQDIGDLGGALDSTRTGYIYLSETLSKIKYIKPEIFETITASKVSGDSNGISFNSAMDVDFNLYNNTVSINNEIISPIADYAFNYYNYKLEGEFYDAEGHLINKIKLFPKRDNDRVFSGSIYIVEDSWALYGADLYIKGTQVQILPAENIRIRQNLSFYKNNNHWLLRSQTIDFGYRLFGFKGDGSFVANYNNYQLNPEISMAQNKKEILVFEKDANKKETSFWEEKRPVPLTTGEFEDYIKRDSIETTRNSKVYLDSVDRVKNKFKIGNLLSDFTNEDSYNKKSFTVSGPLNGISFNTVQGYNLSLNSNFTKRYNDYKKFITLSGAVNYSIETKRLRGGIQGYYKFNAINNAAVTASISTKVEQFNSLEPIPKFHNTLSSLFFEKNYMKIYDRTFAKVNYSMELFNGFSFNSGLSYEKRKALFNSTDYTIFPKASIDYSSNNPLKPNTFETAAFLNHDLLKFSLGIRIRFGEKFMTYPDLKINVNDSDYPRLFLNYTKGFNASISDYNFDHLRGRLQQAVNLKSLGFFNYKLIGGTFFKNKTLSFIDFKHFNGNQTHVNTMGNYLSSFKNLGYYNYSTSNNFFEYHMEHNFKGYALGKIPYMNKLGFNLVIGWHGISLDGGNPYSEYNVGIANLGWKKYRFLRVDYVRSFASGEADNALMFGLSF